MRYLSLSTFVASILCATAVALQAQNQSLSVGKSYAYFKKIPGQPPNHYRDDGSTYGVHAVHGSNGLGKFSRGVLGDGLISNSASPGPGTPHLGMWAQCCGNAPAADIVFDLGTVYPITDITIGTVISAASNNNAPDDVTVSFSIGGVQYTGAQYHDLETMYGPLSDGHHDLRVMVGGVQVAQYVKLSFDGGSMKEPTGSDPDEKWMLDEITIRGLGATCKAGSSFYGRGLAGSNGVPTLTVSGPPKYGASVSLVLSNSAGQATPGLLLAGLRESTIPFLGGVLLATPLLQLGVAIPATGLQIPFTAPGPLCEIPVCLQLLQLDSGAKAGLSMTRGLRLDFGN